MKSSIATMFFLFFSITTFAAEQRNLLCNSTVEGQTKTEDVRIAPINSGVQLNLLEPFVMVSIVPGTDQISISMIRSGSKDVSIAYGSPANGHTVALVTSLGGDEIKVECASK